MRNWVGKIQRKTNLSQWMVLDVLGFLGVQEQTELFDGLDR